MAPTKKIEVQGIDIAISQQKGQEDYISLTDLMKAQDEDFFISDWLRNKNTLEYLEAWELMNNPIFNYGEFAIIKNQAGLNRFKISAKQWIERTNAIGIISKAGRYGGTYAHKDIAFHFCMWISPQFQLYVVKEYQRLKEAETNPLLGEWNIKRLLSKTNYTIHTDAIQKYITPHIPKEKQTFAYASEADLLNIALWGCTAQQFREANPEQAAQNLNIRDHGTINELIVLSNMESYNALLIENNVDKKERYEALHKMAQSQLSHLNKINAQNKFKNIDNKKLLNK